MTRGYCSTDRSVLRIGGDGAEDFLQGLVTNDVRRVANGLLYAALLTPQGKYLFDFFLFADGRDVLLDVAAPRATALAQRLAMYRLRAPIAIDPTELSVVLGVGPMPEGPFVFPDPRSAELGWRAYTSGPERVLADLAPLDPAELTEIRVRNGVPETGAELKPDESYILEMGFERLHGVDFRKGCYVGQEVTARMKHKTELKKGLAVVQVDPGAIPGSAITTPDGKPVGTLHTVSGEMALAYLRFDRAKVPLAAGSARVTPREASW